MTITLNADEAIVGNQNYLIERGELADAGREPAGIGGSAGRLIQVDSVLPVEDVDERGGGTEPSRRRLGSREDQARPRGRREH